MTLLDTVAIVDDDQRQAETVFELLVDAGFKPIHVPEPRAPLASVDDLVSMICGSASAAICDHRLSPQGLAAFHGAEAVARLYDAKLPAMLLTQFAEPDNDVSIRRWRHKVPVVLARENADEPAIFRASLEFCSRELQGDVHPFRRTQRSIVRIADQKKEDGEEVIDVFVPQWRPYTAVRLPLDCIPPELQAAVRPGGYLLASVNIEARDAAELFFRDFEPAP